MPTSPAQTRRRTGRPSKLTAEVHERIVTAVRAGNYLETAAHFAGVHPGTVFRWMKEADEPGAGRAKVDFRDAVNRARAESEARVVGQVQRIIMGGQVLEEVERRLPNGTVETTRRFTAPDGKVALEFMARAFPSRWARRATLQVTGEDGGPVQVEHTQYVISALAERVHAELNSPEPETVDGEVVEDAEQ